MLPIKSGRLQKPVKAVFYGLEGTGKTTLAAQTPDPLILDTEGGTTYLDVKRIDQFPGWESLINTVEEIARDTACCRTMVIDTADWAEQMAIRHICEKYKQTGLESFGFGKGYTYLAEEFSRLLAACDEVITSGKHVVITAHAKQRRVELPDETGGFDVWGLKLSKQCAPLLKEWPDALLFLNYKTIVVATDSNTHKAQGGKRVIYTNHRPVFDAKNRHGLPDEMELCYDSIAPIFGDAAPQAKAPTPAQPKAAAAPSKPAVTQQPLPPVTPETLKTITEWMDKAGIAAEEIQTLVAQKGHFPPETPIDQYPEKYVRGWLMRNWDQVVTTIMNDPNHVPF